MKTFFELVVIIPIGPNVPIAYIEDTINSFQQYTRSTYKIILTDDSHQGLGKRVQALFPEADLLYTNKPMGWLCGLYVNLGNAYRHALTNYDFKALFKMDTDALIIGEAPEAAALELFSKNPGVGICGQYPNDYNGKPWDIGWPKQRIINGTSTWKYIRRPFANWALRKLYKRALANGYRTGESVLGAAYFVNPLFLEKLFEQGLLPDTTLQSLNLGEDHLYSLLCKALGFTLGDLSAPGRPFGCSWRGLPASPETLILDGKKITHSTRYYHDLQEEEIRSFFREYRTRHHHGHSAPKVEAPAPVKLV